MTALPAATAPPANTGVQQPTVLFGRFMLPDTSEHPCQVVDLSIDGATFITSQIPLGGQPIVAYLDTLGRIEAISAEPVPGGFRVVFAFQGSRRERFEARLRFLGTNIDDDGADMRRHSRYEPKDTKSHISLPDGRVYSCEVIDISLSGAGVKVDVMPSLGTHVMLGKMRGRIVRYLADGIGIEFVKPLERGQLSEHVR